MNKLTSVSVGEAGNNLKLLVKNDDGSVLITDADEHWEIARFFVNENGKLELKLIPNVADDRYEHGLNKSIKTRVGV